MTGSTYLFGKEGPVLFAGEIESSVPSGDPTQTPRFTPVQGFDPEKMALPTDTPEQIIRKMSCFSCHRVPTIDFANIGVIGPLLIEKTNAPNRIQSPEYRKAVQEGRAKATTPKEYVIESIVNPGAFIVPGFSDDMFKVYREKFSDAALETIADFLLTLDEDAARKEEFDRLSDEKEGSVSGK
ncbi:MAG TPA: hypothetical protein VI382_09625 [Candidatus Manganitrophaceae bacterium]|nr:hypothetical protein [Candidatus Manganitrophaceae bacterium]